jgi:single-stranded-DNA-specific exonuclease|uniref:Single-stranded-DNA-specific exonuclease RecJ n=1 Tax=candidate division WOR-3 bacterium TaxID=2052148 RepID=A0A7C4XKZ4_UNCW3
MVKWVSKHQGEVGEEIIIRNKRIPAVIVEILKNRGYKTPEAIEKFFAPSVADLYNPFLMKNMEVAVDRIIKAIERKERILIHGDYDTDGITALALLYRNLKRFDLSIDYYIPHRLLEGYGVSKSGIDYAAHNGCSLIISVDCGVTAFEELSYARSKNIDVIVCDHHNPKSELPPALAILNPKLPECSYPFKELAGVGVAFKFLQGLFQRMNLDENELFSDLDLVALGSVVDVVPLIDENRFLVKLGLKKMSKSKKAGIQALIKVSGLNGELTAYHLGFIIGPRINACGRLRDAKSAIELLLTDDPIKAMNLAQELSEDNQKRQQIEEEILQEAKQIIETRMLQEKRVIVVGKENWHEGVVGIVASRIIEEYARPAIVFSLKQETAKGSARSVSGFDIAQALEFCSDLLIKFGGHKQAAGLEIARKNLDDFEKKINLYAQNFDEIIFTKKHYYDIKLDLNEITDDVVYFLKFFEPTGMENPQPVFLGEDFEVVGVPMVVGKKHLKFSLRKNKKVFPAIAFYHADKILNIIPGKTRIDCLYTIFEDTLVGKKKNVLKIKELKNVETD